MTPEEFLAKQTPKPSVKFLAVGTKWNVDNGLILWTQLAKSIINDWEDINPNLTRELIKYCLRLDDFNGDLNKGILLFGLTGRGKTSYMEVFSLMIEYLHRLKTRTISGLEIENEWLYQDSKADKFWINNILESTLFCFEDIGTEHDFVKIYGSERNVGIEVITQRHLLYKSKGCLTFGTTNLVLKKHPKHQSIEGKYGTRIFSRVHEIFNCLVVDGEDMRRK